MATALFFGLPSPPLSELSSLRAVKALSNEEAAAHPPARLEGTLTFLHEAPFGSFGFLQDGQDEAVYFQFDGPAPLQPSVGTRVELIGRAFPGEFAPGIRAEGIQVLDRGRVPSPAAREPVDLMTGRFDSRWVEVQGVVRRLGFDERVKLHVLTLASDGVRFRAELPGTVDRSQLEGLIGSRISVRGPCGARFNGLRQLIGVRVLVQDPSALKLLAPAPPPEALPLRPIVTLLAFDPEARPDGAVRVQGIVTAIDGERWVLEDESGGVLVEAWGDPAPRPGSSVELQGYIGREGLHPVLEDARVLALRPGHLPAPLEARNLTLPEYALRRVKMRGLVEAVSLVGEEVRLVLKLGQLHIPLTVSRGSLPSRTAPGAEVELVAVVLPLQDRRDGVSLDTLYAERAKSVRLLGAGVDGPIRLLVAPPFWNGTRLGILAASLLGVALTLALLSVVLRRRVARQTIVIRDQLETQKRLRVQAQSASEAKSVFLATMSHELRTPLHGISSTISLLQDSKSLGVEDRDMVDLIESSSQQLLRIVGDVLDLSQAESVGLTLSPRSFELPKLLREVVELNRPRASAEGLELSLLLAEDLPHWVETDPVRVRQVLENLLTNALKFTCEGSIQVRAGRAGGDQVRIEVQDSGPGLSEADQGRLFQPFIQAEAGRKRRHDGSGLGLAIARELSTLLGGTIGVRSREGDGSTFFFTFQASESTVAAKSASQDGPAQLRPMSVLVVDDNAVNRRVASAMLTRDGHQVAVAKNGHEAVQQVETGHFELVLMDLHMPEMDGLEATQAIKALHARRTPIIIGLTADALPTSRDACMEAGMRSILTKPFTAASLRAALARELTDASS